MGRDRSRSPSDSDRRRERHREKSKDRDDPPKRRSRSRDGDRDRESSRRRHRSQSRDGERSHKRWGLWFCAQVILIESTFYRQKHEDSKERKARKAEKKRAKAEEEARQVAELSVYSATDNPFHDINLGQQFRWHKKAEKERKQGLTVAEAQHRDVLRRQEAKEELERLNKRRADREAEQRLREQEEIKMQRLNESAQMSSWLAKDDDFQLDQERQRAIIRIKERRAKAVDFLALNLRYANPDPEEDHEFDLDAAGVEIDLDEPYNIFDVGFFLLVTRAYVLTTSPEPITAAD
jgi:hypothetical protein